MTTSDCISLSTTLPLDKQSCHFYSCNLNHIITCHMLPRTRYNGLLKKVKNILNKVISCSNIYNIWLGKEYSFRIILKWKCNFHQSMLVLQGQENSLSSDKTFWFAELNQRVLCIQIWNLPISGNKMLYGSCCSDAPCTCSLLQPDLGWPAFPVTYHTTGLLKHIRRQ